MRAAKVLVIGDVFSPAMEPARRSLRSLLADGSDVRLTADIPGAPRTSVGLDQAAARSAHARDSAGEWFPQLVLVCQQWPDEFAENDVWRLIGLYPLARLVCCYGPWCESDGRTRETWPLSVRVPVRSVADRIRRELDVITGLVRPLPLTASRDEVFLFEAQDDLAERFDVPS